MFAINSSAVKKCFGFVTTLLFSFSLQASLKVGEPAPDFRLQAALAGEPFEFALQEALQRGPVVIFFYPKAFTKGCSIEARLFGEHMDEFAKVNTSVIGISNDDIETLKKFSVEDCAGKFPVAADPQGEVIKAYDARIFFIGSTAKRVSYVVTPDSKIYMQYSAMDPKQHVSLTLEAARRWHEKEQSVTAPDPLTSPE